MNLVDVVLKIRDRDKKIIYEINQNFVHDGKKKFLSNSSILTCNIDLLFLTPQNISHQNSNKENNHFLIEICLLLFLHYSTMLF